MRSFVFVLVLGAGCSLYQGGSGDDQRCATPAGVGVDMLVDPATLLCQTFTFGGECDPACGQGCPATGQLDIPAPPPWGACQSTCTQLDETTCAATPGCRVALDWTKYYTNQSSFLGCFAVDTDHDTSTTCAGLDTDGCARHDSCTALYETLPDDCAGCADEQFKECIPEGQAAGTCTGPVACDPTFSCPAGTTPGRVGDCYTGSCIPDQFCAPQP